MKIIFIYLFINKVVCYFNLFTFYDSHLDENGFFPESLKYTPCFWFIGEFETQNQTKSTAFYYCKFESKSPKSAKISKIFMN